MGQLFLIEFFKESQVSVAGFLQDIKIEPVGTWKLPENRFPSAVPRCGFENELCPKVKCKLNKIIEIK